MSIERAPPPYEILEHTADIGLRAVGRTIGELFENACSGMLEIIGAKTDDGRNEEGLVLDMSGNDLGGLLVDFLNEVIYLVDRFEARIAGVAVQVDGNLLVSTIKWGASPDPPDGTELKAATYHQLSVRQTDGGWEATIFFDV